MPIDDTVKGPKNPDSVHVVSHEECERIANAIRVEKGLGRTPVTGPGRVIMREGYVGGQNASPEYEETHGKYKPKKINQ